VEEEEEEEVVDKEVVVVERRDKDFPNVVLPIREVSRLNMPLLVRPVLLRLLLLLVYASESKGDVTLSLLLHKEVDPVDDGGLDNSSRDLKLDLLEWERVLEDLKLDM